MTSFGDAILGSQGIRSSWEGDAANQAVQALKSGNQQAYNNWVDQQHTLSTNSVNLAGTNFSAGAQNAYQNQLANYNQQQTAAGMLYNQATGNAPSAADLQMQAGLGQANNAIQSAMLSQQGGVSPGLSQRNMLNAQAAQNANIVSSGAANRAQELASAQNNYSGLLGQMGQTAAGMTNFQNTLGQQYYNQAQNNLAYQTNAAAQGQAMQAANAQSGFAADMANVTGQSAANAQQYQAGGNDVSSFMNGLTAITSKKF